jgi:hypothetical protein
MSAWNARTALVDTVAAGRIGWLRTTLCSAHDRTHRVASKTEGVGRKGVQPLAIGSRGLSTTHHLDAILTI